MTPRKPRTDRPAPDRQYYLQAAERLGGNRAGIAVARKLLKRCYQCVTNAEGGIV
jgi:hypothetical protein